MTLRGHLRRSAAGACADIGVVAALAPARVPALFGGAAGTPDARTEVRAVHAGIPLALAASLTAASGSTPGDDAVLRTVGAAGAGMAVARSAGCVAERRLTARPSGAFLALEAALAVALRAAAQAGGSRRTG
ncbi:DUF4345 family protein [Geodermatophilus obscurus]|uniref:Uncharacterized protein n=1 Tax=Geodermatophilus obscurus (strain ATCC 25078 / DSM 43160 / JCM 3152 / CCUG 61914 / KCC A-0152 / KCTC 9177 / NBRC 13315 / NRRL B-3577 / G-20) TaxID=526225 RepID=D2SAW7_GEOOG|nr:DUF4345 family protein [Geodermatophilus obscurus]ADB76002.1 conserved hypothetical protein [Geodermatophilus obscurus DSM 43160]